MIYLTQGHERSIAIETLVKSLYMLPDSQLKNFIYYVNNEVLQFNIDHLKLPLRIVDNELILSKNKRITCNFIKSDIESSSFESIKSSIKEIKNDDILVTMPTSKDKFVYGSKQYAGHTDFFRSFYQNELTMNFINNNEQVLILTDHVPISKVGDSLTLDSVINQITTSIKNLKYHFSRTINDVLISGINPHSGERGLIGTEDIIIEKSIEILQKKFPRIKFKGPIPGDSLALQINQTKQTLQVFCHHDQALSYFKFKNGIIGINTTFGLEFLRLSVDHGTAKELYGLNLANPIGSYFVLNNALRIHERKRS
jgi:4-hydroxy-L-threonine phosphate dehydrogenase PdxA